MDETDKKEKVPPLQVFIRTGPSKSRPAELLFKAFMQESKQSCQSEKMAKKTRKQRLLQISRKRGTCPGMEK